MPRSFEEIQLAANLIRRGTEILEGVDQRTLPGDPLHLRTQYRRMIYGASILVEELDEITEALDQNPRF